MDKLCLLDSDRKAIPACWPVVVSFLGEPFCYEEPLEDSQGTNYGFELRVLINVYAGSSEKMRILDMDVEFFKDLLRVREKYGLEKYLYEISPNGILLERELNLEERARISSIPLNSLGEEC